MKQGFTNENYWKKCQKHLQIDVQIKTNTEIIDIFQ